MASERPRGVFSRQLILGDTLDTEHIKASYDAGVLTLRIPVAEQAKPRKIEIETKRPACTRSETSPFPGRRQAGCRRPGAPGTMPHESSPETAMTSQPDYYDVLRVTPAASQQEISRAYRALMRTHHPDLDGGPAGGGADGGPDWRTAADHAGLRGPARPRAARSLRPEPHRHKRRTARRAPVRSSSRSEGMQTGARLRRPATPSGSPRSAGKADPGHNRTAHPKEAEPHERLASLRFPSDPRLP